MPWLLVAGFVLGFGKSVVPLGPTAVLIVHRGLAGRFAGGLAIAAGGALAEFFYCLGAVLGLQALAGRHSGLFEAIRGVGVAVILAIGAYLVVRPPRPTAPEDAGQAQDWPKELLLGLSTTGFNPTLIFTWTAVIGVLISVGDLRFEGANAYLFPAAVIAGSLAWNAVLLGLLRRWGGLLREPTLAAIMRVLGIGLIGVGVWQVVRPAPVPGPETQPPGRHQSRSSLSSFAAAPGRAILPAAPRARGRTPWPRR